MLMMCGGNWTASLQPGDGSVVHSTGHSPASFSVVIPAHNEEALIRDCLDSVRVAAGRVEGEVACIVVLNACTDATERIARENGATIAFCEQRNLAVVRNAGAAVATGEILVTIDADSRMAADALTRAEEALASGRYIGGGVPIVPDRRSVGIVLTGILILTLCAALGVPSAGMFWCYRRDFEAIGGFDETLHSGEDVDFARRLKRHGCAQGKRYGTLRKTPIHTSCRKFDQFGDWSFVRLALLHPRRCWRVLRGREPGLADRFWYAVER